MPSKKLALQDPGIDNLIRAIRGQNVILDSALARVYGVSTKAFNQAVKRNLARFPEGFIFQLSKGEAEAVQISRSQAVTLKRGQNVKYLPYAFTEHGALQAANILNSVRAVQMSVFVIRAFVKMREELAADSAMVKRLAQIDNTLFLHDSALRDLYQKLRPLLAPPRAAEKAAHRIYALTLVTLHSPAAP
jgi:phage regulator Rha-like protein